MANFNQHLDHALDNISHLTFLNQERPEELRWQLTTVYYISVQLVHAYIASEVGMHPGTHEELKSFITPNSFMPTKFSNELYAEYINLEMKSRYARYNSDFNITTKHLCESFEILEKVILFFNAKYPKSKINTFDLFIDKQIVSYKFLFLKVLHREVEADEE